MQLLSTAVLTLLASRWEEGGGKRRRRAGGSRGGVTRGEDPTLAEPMSGERKDGEMRSFSGAETSRRAERLHVCSVSA